MQQEEEEEEKRETPKYTFQIHPETFQPSGCADFSKIIKQRKIVYINVDAKNKDIVLTPKKIEIINK